MGENKEVSNVFLATLFSMLVVLLLFISYIIFIPSVNYKLRETFEDKIELTTDFSGGGFYWDKVDHTLKISVRRGNDELDLRKLRFQFFYGIESFEFISDKVPQKGSLESYEFIFESFNDAPDIFIISPIIGGVEDDLILSITNSEVVSKDFELSGEEIIIDKFEGGYILGI